MQRRKLLPLSLCAVLYCSAPGQAALNDMAVFTPGVANWMTIEQQNDVSTYLTAQSRLPQTQIYNHTNQSDLVAWMNQRMSDGKSDVLLIIDLAPSQIFNDNDNSLAEAWMENGNMLIWTGSEPFRASVDAGGVVTDHATDGINDGANKVLDIKGEDLCTGYASVPQQETSVASAASGFYDYLPSLNLNYTGPDMRSLSYVDVLTEAENVVSQDDAPALVIDEIFAENSDLQDTAHVYESDAVVLTMRQTENDRKGQGGQYAQFYCYKGLVDGVDSNEYRKPVLYEFLHNWVARDVDLIYVQAGAVDGNGSQAKPYGTIQAGINTADAFSRDRVVVLPGTYKENLVMKGSVKLISAGDDVRGNIVGHLDDFNNPELALTYNTFPQINAKKGLARAQATIIDGTALPVNKPLVHLPKGATLGTWVDGFTIQNMPAVNQTVCGHAQAIQSQGSSPLFIDNIVLNNGSAGFGASAVFDVNSDGVSVEDDICQNNDFRYANVKYDARPALINNIIGANDGPNLSDDYYAYSILYRNESFKSGYFGDDLPEPLYDAPGIRAQHGAHPYIYNNAVYDSSGAGIDARRGVNELVWSEGVDRPTRPVINDNYVFNSGTSTLKESGAGIGALNSGGHDPYSGQDLYQIIDGNFIHTSAKGAVGCLYDENEDGGTTTVPQNNVGYVVINNNTGTKAGTAGIEIHGCANVFEIAHNELTGNTRAGIGIAYDAEVGDITDNSLYSNGMAGIGMKEGAQVAAIRNNSLLNNGKAGIGHDGSAKRVVVGEEVGNTIEWNRDAGIGIVHSDVGTISMNSISNNAAPGITVINDSHVGLIEGSASTEGPERLTDNGRGDLHESTGYTAGLAIQGQGSTANISNLLVEGSGRVNVEIGAGTIVSMNKCTIRNNYKGSPNIHTAGDTTITNCLLENAAGPGLVAAGGDAILSLKNTTVQNSGLVGVKIQGATVTSFQGNTVSGSATAGISAGSLAAELIIKDSFIINNGTPGVSLSSTGFMVTVLNSEISNNGIGGFQMANSSVDIRDSVIHNYKGGVMLHDNTVEHTSTVSLDNCDLEHPESSVRVFGAGSLSIINSSLQFVEVRDTESVYIKGSTNDTWNIGIDLVNIGWVDIIGNDLGARWPVRMVNSSGNIINNVNALSSDGYVFDNSNVNFNHNTVYLGDSEYIPGDPNEDTNLFGFNAKNGSVVYAYNNIITGATNCVSSQSNSIVYFDHNTLWGCTRRNFFTFTGGTINIGNNNLLDVDPQLINPLNGNYHLFATSPCIDAGDSAIGVTTDMDGDARPQGGRSDIGADEVL